MFVPSVWKNMMGRIQNSRQNASIIFISHAFWNGWKEVISVLCVIRKWFLALQLISNNKKISQVFSQIEVKLKV
ncbi:hypothetical protein SDJN02_02828 [Cucurbita argyrosperma subsp. argyrosperma]|nr:hypothetical protein SDJN02_02828 [Cucurbita argyrosperma subsp. argyrosperma]